METKQEVVQLINSLPEEILEDVLQYLRQIEKASQDKMRQSINLKTILAEDQDLLKRLAQ